MSAEPLSVNSSRSSRSRRSSSSAGSTTEPQTVWYRNREFWFWAVTLLVMAAPWEDLLRGVGLDTAGRYFKFAFAAVTLIGFIKARPMRKAYLIGLWPFYGYLAYALVSSVLGGNIGLSLKELGATIALIASFAVAAYRLRPIDYCRALMLVMFVCCLLSLIVIFAMPSVGVSVATTEAGIDNIGGWHGIFPHKNLFGHIAAFLFGVMLLCGRDLFPFRVSWLAALAVGALCLVGAKSSTAIIIAVILPAFYIAAVKPEGALRFVSLSGVAVVFGTFILFRDQIVHGVLGLLGKNSNLSGRSDIWAECLDEFAQRPVFGHGFGYTKGDAFVSRLQMLFQVSYTHNQYLDVLLNVGILGVAIYLGVIGYACFLAWRSRLSGRTGDARAMLTVLLAGLVISGFSETSGGMLAQLLYGSIFGLTALAARARTEGRSRSSTHRQSASHDPDVPL
jgi:O-antigen ligase